MEAWNREQVIEETKEEVFDLLKSVVRPEFLNRIDEIVLFQPLTKANIREIVGIQFKQIQARLEEQHITLDATTEALDKLGNEGYDPTYGARPLKRAMQRLVLNELSKQILAGYIKPNSVVLMDVDADSDIYFKNVEAVAV